MFYLVPLYSSSLCIQRFSMVVLFRFGFYLLIFCLFSLLLNSFTCLVLATFFFFFCIIVGVMQVGIGSFFAGFQKLVIGWLSMVGLFVGEMWRGCSFGIS